MDKKLCIPSVDAIDLINTYRDMCMICSQYRIEMNIPKEYSNFYFAFFEKTVPKSVLPEEFVELADGELIKDSMGIFMYKDKDGKFTPIEHVYKVEKAYAVLIYLDKCGSLKNGFSLPFNTGELRTNKEKWLDKVIRDFNK